MLNRRFWPPLMPFLMGVPTRVFACSRRPKEVSISSTRASLSGFDTELQRLSMFEIYMFVCRDY